MNSVPFFSEQYSIAVCKGEPDYFINNTAGNGWNNYDCVSNIVVHIE